MPRSRLRPIADACTATSSVAAPGTFATQIPRARAASTSTMSYPTDIVATIRSRGSAAISSAVTGM